ncbi:hypothetical protein [Bizionia arctica]|uniref:Uncharacterized protein n=1 Tax=Bizionia arctica TaxID=1495645 RepID=A0A917GIA5_9FLAO|nr:hypothetical protein [Bizionia arctica]GGG46743.1 hypothetical protein GCM10010976_17730 [Bizionia arctica]
MITHSNILDLNSKRKYLHFVKNYKNLLFTIQEDNILTIWKIEVPFQLRQLVKIPLEERFYEPNFQFIDNTLLLRGNRGNKIAIINFQNLDKPTVIIRQREMGYIKGACIAKDKLYIQISSLYNKDYRFEVSDIPTINNTDPISKIVIPDKNEESSAFYSLVFNDTIYWVNQDSIFLMDISEPDHPKSIVTKEIVNLGIGYPILLSDNRMIVFEIASDVRIGLNYLDISGNNVKRKAKGLFKNHCIRGWQVIDNTLYMVHLDLKNMNNERKYKTYLSSIDLSSDPVINFTKELPIIEVYGEDNTTIVWYYISNNKHIILQGNGTFYELPF